MDDLRRFVVLMAGLVVGVVTTVLVMIYGWGLEPQSYFWIIGVYLFGHLFSYFLYSLAKNG